MSSAKKITEDDIKCQFCPRVASFQYLDFIVDPQTNEEYFQLIPLCYRHLIRLEAHSH